MVILLIYPFFFVVVEQGPEYRSYYGGVLNLNHNDFEGCCVKQTTIFFFQNVEQTTRTNGTSRVELGEPARR